MRITRSKLMNEYFVSRLFCLKHLSQLGIFPKRPLRCTHDLDTHPPYSVSAGRFQRKYSSDGIRRVLAYSVSAAHARLIKKHGVYFLSPERHLLVYSLSAGRIPSKIVMISEERWHTASRYVASHQKERQ